MQIKQTVGTEVFTAAGLRESAATPRRVATIVLRLLRLVANEVGNRVS